MPIPTLPQEPGPTPADCRCHCGSLLARLLETGVELKCRRCKQTHVIPWERVEPRRPEPSPASRARILRKGRGTPWLEVLDEPS